MSSSRGKQKKSKRTSPATPSSSSSSELPSAWSAYDWNLEKGCWQRYRLDSAGEYEIQYETTLPSGEPAFEPRSAPSLSSTTLPEVGMYQTVQTPANYTTASNSSVETITASMYQTGLRDTQQEPSLPSGPKHIRTRDPYSKKEQFNPHYRVHDAWEFKWGRIFKVLWVEPRGMGGQGSNSGSGGSTSASYTQRNDENGEERFEKVRRFIVINPMKGHCICLPINTYSGQGVNKRGVHAEHHTIVYSEENAVYLPGEIDRGLTKIPLKMTCSSRHQLDENSRLNYAKTYTVEYNVKVCFVGKIHKNSEWQLTADFNNTHPLVPHRTPRPPEDDLTRYAEGGSSAYNDQQQAGNWRSDGSSSSSRLPFSYENVGTFLPDQRDNYVIEEENENEQDQHDGRYVEPWRNNGKGRQ